MSRFDFLSLARAALPAPAGARAVFLACCAMAVMLPMVAVLSHRSVTTILGLTTLVCVVVFFAGGIADRKPAGQFIKGLLNGLIKGARRPDRGQVCLMAVIGFGLWTAISAIWTPLDDRGAIFIHVLGPIIAMMIILRALAGLGKAAINFIATLFAMAIAVMAVLLGFETVTGGALRALTPPEDLSWHRHKDFTALGRGSAVMVLLIFPAMAIAFARTGKYWPGALLVLVGAVSAGGLAIAANMVALVAASLAGLVVWRFPRTGIRAIAGLVGVALFATPLAAMILPAEALNEALVGVLPVSWLQRFYVWQAIGDAIGSGLPWGHGVDYARWLAQNGATVDIPGAFGPLPVVPTHPHNVFLQIWLETGLPGVLAIAIAIWSGAARLSVLAVSRGVMAAIAAVITASLVSFMVEASLWQVWRISALAIAAFGLTLAHYSFENPAAGDARATKGARMA